jgi:hypothetical protein
VVRKDETRVRRLLGRTLSIETAGGDTSATELGEESLEPALRELGVELLPAEVARLPRQVFGSGPSRSSAPDDREGLPDRVQVQSGSPYSRRMACDEGQRSDLG